MSQIIYPCLVIDVGFNNLPPKFDKMSIEEAINSELNIEEFALIIVENEYTELDEDDIGIFDVKTVTKKKELFNTLKLIKQFGTIISHNIKTDLKVLDVVHRKLFNTPFTEILNINTFCTMLEGLPYSTCHVYRGGKKVKKYPTLQQLFNNLTNKHIGKGDIFLDAATCYLCFRALEKKKNELIFYH